MEMNGSSYAHVLPSDPSIICAYMKPKPKIFLCQLQIKSVIFINPSSSENTNRSWDFKNFNRILINRWLCKNKQDTLNSIQISLHRLRNNTDLKGALSYRLCKNAKKLMPHKIMENGQSLQKICIAKNWAKSNHWWKIIKLM